MCKRCFLMLSLMLLGFHALKADSYLVNGGQESNIRYRMTQTIRPTPAMSGLTLSFVVPQSFQSPTYNQRISALNFDFQPSPANRQETVDSRGNKILEVKWSRPTGTIQSTISLVASNQTILQKLSTAAPFPDRTLPPEVKAYLKATAQVPADDQMIHAKAVALTQGATTQFDAVQRILAWVVDHMHYVLTPASYDAKYSFNTGKGNCQNYSHLAAALMRSVGIPARIVNGITLKQPYEIQTTRGTLLMKIAQGRHSWIEVYFSDLKWVPFDPQQTQLFVSNRFIRVEVGLDNEETKQDGLIRWSQSSNAYGQPDFEEDIEADFQSDRVSIAAEPQNYGPKNLLLTPPVQTNFIPYKTDKIEPPPPPPVSPGTLKQLRYRKLLVFGNLEFPVGINFAEVRGPARPGTGNQMEMQKNFMVETAEYVTSQEQYAQVFLVEKPMRLKSVSLALHKFGGGGTLWLELFKEANELPGAQIATSELLDVNALRYQMGYDWQGFDFSREEIILAPGRYWMALGFTGSPIINWFYSYGKPVGPQYGTRYKTILETQWSRSLPFEFNYKVEGLTTE
ncbi:transglutaminase domain-containing protein [candidate division KSB1 bacterium]|nr:transglutaminase domain-containing protein [candidate division KSB1 bacterium]